MDIKIKDVIKSSEKNIILPPGLLCPKWEGVIDIVIAEKIFLLHDHLGNERYNSYAPVNYLLCNCAQLNSKTKNNEKSK